MVCGNNTKEDLRLVAPSEPHAPEPPGCPIPQARTDGFLNEWAPQPVGPEALRVPRLDASLGTLDARHPAPQVSLLSSDAEKDADELLPGNPRGDSDKSSDLTTEASSKEAVRPSSDTTGEAPEQVPGVATLRPSWSSLQAYRQVTSADLTKVIPEVKTWDRKRFRARCKLQDALRNQGEVWEMEDTNAKDQEVPGEFARVAMKQMPNSWVLDSKKFSQKHPEATERPRQDIGCVCYLNSTDYPYACKLTGIFQDRKTTYVATSLCSEGDLFTWCLQDPPPGGEREKGIFSVVVQICSAVRWLHEHGIVHRDISMENILLTKMPGGGLRVRLIDFGMSTLNRRSRRELRGKQSYQAPEIHLDVEYDGFLTDAFAVGVTVFCVAAKDYPWSMTKAGGCKIFDYVRSYGLRCLLERRKLRNGALFLKVFSEPFFELVSGLTCLDPSQRTALGEANWAQEGIRRSSVWDCKWMECLEDVVEPWLLSKEAALAHESLDGG